MRRTKTEPVISTIIATHNRPEYLLAAVESIVNQTYQNFEIIIIDDASSDETSKIILELIQKDNRIIAVRSNINIGPGAARNLGIARANGEYIAIMDDDDISHEERFAKQIVFLEKNPEVMIVGSFIQKIDHKGNKIGEIHYPLTNGQIRWGLFFRCSVGHATTMIRKTLFSDLGFSYSDSLMIGEDWQLFVNVIKNHKIANLPELLYFYRRYPDSITVKEPELELNSTSNIIMNEVKKITGLDLPKNLVTCFIRPKLIKNNADGKIVSNITIKLYKSALKWNLSEEDKRYISANTASRLRHIWKNLNYPIQLLPYVFYSLLIDPGIVKRKLSLRKTW